MNQAPITGEFASVDKVAGADVFAGSINGHGALYVTVTRAPGDTLLARIIALVKAAQVNRPRRSSSSNASSEATRRSS